MQSNYLGVKYLAGFFFLSKLFRTFVMNNRNSIWQRKIQ